jgi:hypothetical protein
MGSTWIRSYSIEGVCPYEYNYLSIKAYNVIPAIGGGYLVQGFVEYFDYEFWVWAANVFWKVDENGEVIWRRSGLRWEPYNIIISNGVDRYYCIASISGYSWMEIYDNQMNYIGSYDFELINGIYPSINDAVITDDGIVFAVQLYGEAVILKTDFELNLEWLGDSTTNHIVSGFTKLNRFNGGWIGASTGLIAFMDAVGDTIWTYDGNSEPYYFQDCILTHDNQVFGIGFHGVTGDYYLFGFDLTNQSVTTIPIDYNLYIGLYPPALIEGADGKLVFYDLGPNSEILRAYSRSGERLWSRYFSPTVCSSLGYGASNILTTDDYEILFCAVGYDGITLVKTDSNGIVVSNEDPILTPSAISSSHYPNPASDQITIDYKAESRESILTLEVFNIRGQMLYSCPLTGSEGSHQLSLLQDTDSRWAPGVYMYRVKDEHSGTSISKKFIKTR